MLTTFLMQWAITALSLWVASFVFKGIRFESTASLIVSALVLGFVNALLRPLLILLTLPLSLLTLGLFLLVINALMLMLVSAWVRGFTVSGFWTAFFASIFITLLGMFFSVLLFGGAASWQEPMPMPAHPGWL
ncbi:MAG TPA: phage holin family protein [Macromonas sp.]|nr:phage holin family protein [Macromonas sp.]